MRIAIDIDSTLHDYWPELAAAAKKRFGVEIPYEHQHTWHIPRLRPEQLQACIRDTHCPAAIARAEPYPGAVQAVNAWHDAGHFIHITSHRAPATHEDTVRWLHRVGLRHHELYCSYDKVSRCVEIGIELLIDDSPVNLAGALEHGIAAATLRHPWNRDVVEEEEDVIAADDWHGLAQALRGIVDGRRAA
ncbi:MAG: 5' nucleotidase, NT5C type [Solirubrobacteraceae bacterium]